jgi:RNA polymerase sigma-70 factor (ECF subfamily)
MGKSNERCAKIQQAVASRDREERRLATRLGRREPDALRELYDLHGRATFGFLLRAPGERAAAEDVQQQVFLEAWQRGERYDPERGGLLTWLLQIARSRAIDHLRRRVPEPRDPASAVALADRADDFGVDELLEHWRMAGELDLLPGEEADLLRRRFYLGQSQTEIATATGLPLGTVKSRMVSGLRRLRESLEGEW